MGSSELHEEMSNKQVILRDFVVSGSFQGIRYVPEDGNCETEDPRRLRKCCPAEESVPVL